MSPAPGVAPLGSVVMSYVCEETHLSEATAMLLENQTRAYLEHRVTFRDIVATFHQCIGTSAPIERLHDIIHTNETPLPKRSSAAECCGRRKICPWTLWEHQPLYLLASIGSVLTIGKWSRSLSGMTELVHSVVSVGVEDLTLGLPKILGRLRAMSDC
jgi:hypothetical protein